MSKLRGLNIKETTLTGNTNYNEIMDKKIKWWDIQQHDKSKDEPTSMNGDRDAEASTKRGEEEEMKKNGDAEASGQKATKSVGSEEGDVDFNMIRVGPLEQRVFLVVYEVIGDDANS